MKAITILVLLLSWSGTCSADETLAKDNLQFYLRDSVGRSSGLRSDNISDFLKTQSYVGLDLKVIDKFGKFKETHMDLSPLRKFSQISLNLSGLGRISKFDEDQICQWLSQIGKFQETTSSLLQDKTQSLLYWCSFVNGGKHILSVDSETFEKTADFLSRKITEQKRYFDEILIEEKTISSNLNFEALLAEIAWVDFFRALTRGREFETSLGFKETFEHSTQQFHNLILFRSIQHSPKKFVIIPSSKKSSIYDPQQFNLDQKFRKDILEFSSKIKRTLDVKKTANLVIGIEKKYLSKKEVAVWTAPILNALQASGYEIRITFDQVLPGNKLYYFLVDHKSMSRKTHNKLNQLLEAGAKGSGPMVILHPLSEIRDSGHGKKIRQFFKIPSSERGWLKDPPEFVQLAGQSARWGNLKPKGKFGMTYIRQRRVNEEGGSVVLSAVSNSETLAFILRAGNHYLVNGNILDFEAAYFLSQLMGGPLQSPTQAFVTSGSNHIAAFARSKTTLKFKMPEKQTKSPWKVIRFNAQGEKILDDILKKTPKTNTPLEPNELVIYMYQ